MDQKQRIAFKVWEITTEAVRAWVQAHPAPPGQQVEIPDALVDAMVAAEKAYQVTRNPTPSPENIK